MTDYTKSTHATDARGNKVRVEFVKAIVDELVFAFLEPFHNGVMMRAPCQKVFGSDGKHLSEKTITLCPPEPEEQPLDWTKPLVAVDTQTGERVEVKLQEERSWRGNRVTWPFAFDDRNCWLEDGHNSTSTRYRIENRPEEPPEWALKRACELAGITLSDCKLGIGERFQASIHAHAITLAEHEEEPVDPLEKAVNEALSTLPPEWDRQIFVESVAGTLRKHGVEAKAGDA